MPYYEKNWTQLGVTNWNKSLTKIRQHENTDIHLTAAFKYSTYISGQNIKNCLSTSAKIASIQRKKKMEANRKSMFSLLELSLFFARQNIAFRGHNEGPCSSNRGNFKELVELMQTLSNFSNG